MKKRGRKARPQPKVTIIVPMSPFCAIYATLLHKHPRSALKQQEKGNFTIFVMFVQLIGSSVSAANQCGTHTLTVTKVSLYKKVSY